MNSSFRSPRNEHKDHLRMLMKDDIGGSPMASPMMWHTDKNRNRSEGINLSASFNKHSGSFNNGSEYDTFIGKIQNSMKKDVKDYKLGNVSKTLRSTLLPHAFNITPN